MGWGQRNQEGQKRVSHRDTRVPLIDRPGFPIKTPVGTTSPSSANCSLISWRAWRGRSRLTVTHVQQHRRSRQNWRMRNERQRGVLPCSYFNFLARVASADGRIPTLVVVGSCTGCKGIADPDAFRNLSTKRVNAGAVTRVSGAGGDLQSARPAASWHTRKQRGARVRASDTRSAERVVPGRVNTHNIRQRNYLSQSPQAGHLCGCPSAPIIRRSTGCLYARG